MKKLLSLIVLLSILWVGTAHAQPTEERTPFKPLYGTTFRYSAAASTGSTPIPIGIGSQVFVENLDTDRCYFSISNLNTVTATVPGNATPPAVTGTAGSMPAPSGRPILISDYRTTDDRPKYFVAVCASGESAVIEVTTGYGN